MQHLTIHLAERSYPILIDQGLLSNPESWQGLPSASSAVIVSNSTVAPLYAPALQQALAPHYQRLLSIELPDGETYKTWHSAQQIFDLLLSQGCDRNTVLFALGGGVMGDLTGFAAACYMRGVPFVQVPTTLLAQVDSSVGGKTAINHPLGKNMIGAFYQPVRVVCDLSTLHSLPDRELSAGLAEVIKYGPIYDLNFFHWIEDNIESLRRRDMTALSHAVRRSCEIKAEVVRQDERDEGLRAILNFGHTFAHAIEVGLGYGTWLHGEAVGCGMVMAARLSQRMGLIDAPFVNRLQTLIERAGLPVLGPKLGAATYLRHMRHDKKTVSGAIKFVLIGTPGRLLLRSAPDALVTEVIEATCEGAA